MLLRPGTDGALACAVMHCLFRDGHADWDYLERYTDARASCEAHLKTRTPEWASRDHRLSGREIEAFARLVGTTQAHLLPARLRLLALAQRRRQHACGDLHRRRHRRLAHEGGGAFHNNGAIYPLEQELIEGSTCSIRRCACSISRASARS